MKYQFQIDNRPAGPIRDTWNDAAWDAVNAGYGTWQVIGMSLYLDDTQGATIERFRDVRPSEHAEDA